MTDKEIIDLYISGKRESAFNQIVDTYTERLYWHIRRFLCSHEDANDLLQDIFIKVWAALPSFRWDAQLYTWLYRIATNEVLNYLRRQKVRAMISLDSANGILARKIDEDPYFNGDELASGVPIPLRIRNYKVENYSEHNLYAQVSLTLKDGTVIETEEVALTFRWLTEQVNANHSDYTTDQLAAFRAMLQKFTIVKEWNIPNLLQDAAV